MPRMTLTRDQDFLFRCVNRRAPQLQLIAQRPPRRACAGRAQHLKLVKSIEMRPVRKGRKPNPVYRTREHLTEAEVAKLLNTLKQRRHGHRDWLIGLMIYRHGLRVSEACDLRWDDIDLTKRTIIVRRLKGSIDSSHYLERDELTGLKRLKREQEADGNSSSYVFVNERGQPFGRMGIARIIERAGEAAGLAFSITNTVRYTAMSAEPFKDIWQ
jgi:integrase